MIKWTKVRTGEETANIGYVFYPRGEESRWEGRLTLKYMITRSQFGGEDEVTEVEYGIDLETTACNFGASGGGFGARS